MTHKQITVYNQTQNTTKTFTSSKKLRVYLEELPYGDVVSSQEINNSDDKKKDTK